MLFPLSYWHHCRVQFIMLLSSSLPPPLLKIIRVFLLAASLLTNTVRARNQWETTVSGGGQFFRMQGQSVGHHLQIRFPWEFPSFPNYLFPYNIRKRTWEKGGGRQGNPITANSNSKYAAWTTTTTRHQKRKGGGYIQKHDERMDDALFNRRRFFRVFSPPNSNDFAVFLK